MNNNFYDILGVSKTATQDDIKKAYRKKAMEYHPDRNKGNKDAEEKFKKINEAYDTLGDQQKRKNYDMFGSSKGNPFGGGSYSSGGGNPFGGSSGAGFDFSDFFKNAGGGQSYSYSSGGGGGGFDFSDFFSGGGFASGNTRGTQSRQSYEENLDINRVYEVPIFDLILGCKIEVKGYSGETGKLKIPKFTSSGTKFRVSGFGKKSGSKTGNLIVEVKGIMPKSMSETDEELLKKISNNLKY